MFILSSVGTIYFFDREAIIQIMDIQWILRPDCRLTYALASL